MDEGIKTAFIPRVKASPLKRCQIGCGLTYGRASPCSSNQIHVFTSRRTNDMPRLRVHASWTRHGYRKLISLQPKCYQQNNLLEQQQQANESAEPTRVQRPEEIKNHIVKVEAAKVYSLLIYLVELDEARLVAFRFCTKGGVDHVQIGQTCKLQDVRNEASRHTRNLEIWKLQGTA